MEDPSLIWPQRTTITTITTITSTNSRTSSKSSTLAIVVMSIFHGPCNGVHRIGELAMIVIGEIQREDQQECGNGRRNNDSE